MNKVVLFLLFYFFFLGFLTYSLPACIHNSYNLEKKYDYKSWHFVHCSCPCGDSQQRTILDTGLCLKCRHRRIEHPLNWKQFTSMVGLIAIKK